MPTNSPQTPPLTSTPFTSATATILNTTFWFSPLQSPTQPYWLTGRSKLEISSSNVTHLENLYMWYTCIFYFGPQPYNSNSTPWATMKRTPVQSHENDQQPCSMREMWQKLLDLLWFAPELHGDCKFPFGTQTHHAWQSTSRLEYESRIAKLYAIIVNRKIVWRLWFRITVHQCAVLAFGSNAWVL